MARPRIHQRLVDRSQKPRTVLGRPRHPSGLSSETCKSDIQPHFYPYEGLKIEKTMTLVLHCCNSRKNV
jgi:hypothetical protein